SRMMPPAILNAGKVMPKARKIRLPAMANEQSTIAHVQAERRAISRRSAGGESAVIVRNMGITAKGSTRKKTEVIASSANSNIWRAAGEIIGRLYADLARTARSIYVRSACARHARDFQGIPAERDAVAPVPRRRDLSASGSVTGGKQFVSMHTRACGAAEFRCGRVSRRAGASEADVICSGETRSTALPKR